MVPFPTNEVLFNELKNEPFKIMCQSKLILFALVIMIWHTLCRNNTEHQQKNMQTNANDGPVVSLSGDSSLTEDSYNVMTTFLTTHYMQATSITFRVKIILPTVLILRNVC